ncbi:hypothetical protein Q3G72_033873 [Acer saccharum]|nr:hypothetical protein Q3G72_033873 [Acer saccharum]
MSNTSGSDSDPVDALDELKFEIVKVSNCSLLTDLSPQLQTLTIDGCVDLRMLEFLSSTREMFKKSFLEYLCIESSCDSLRITKSLEKLQIRDCPKLLSFPEGGLRTPNLITIELCNCKNLKVLPDHLHKLTTLLRLDIEACPELESIPEVV